MRLAYPSSIKIISVPCTGRVDLIHLLRAFEKGADGVYLAGCLEGECHFVEGNLRARKRVEQAAGILDTVGVGGERVRIYNMSSTEAGRFAEVALEMHERISALGPNPIKVNRKRQAA